jgi:hypothetical protein
LEAAPLALTRRGGGRQLRESGIRIDKVVDNGQTSTEGSVGKQTAFRNWATEIDPNIDTL